MRDSGESIFAARHQDVSQGPLGKLPRKFRGFPGGQPLSLGSLTPSSDSQKLSLSTTFRILETIWFGHGKVRAKSKRKGTAGRGRVNFCREASRCLAGPSGFSLRDSATAGCSRFCSVRSWFGHTQAVFGSDGSFRDIVACLQNEFCTKDFFLASYEFSYEKCSEIFPEIFEPLFCGSEKIRENSLQISHSIIQISLRKIQKNSPTSFCRSAGRTFRDRVSLCFFRKVCLSCTIRVNHLCNSCKQRTDSRESIRVRRFSDSGTICA